MEYEQHRAGIVRSEVSGPRILGFKIKQANNIHELKSDLEYYSIYLKLQLYSLRLMLYSLRYA